MSKAVNLKELIDEIILEVEKEIEEGTTTGDAAGYEIPHAFSGNDSKSKKKTKDVSTQAGYEIVNESISKKDIKIEKSITGFYNILVWNNGWKPFSEHRFESVAKEVMKAMNSGKGMKYVEKLINKQHQESSSKIIAKSFEKNGIARLIGEGKQIETCDKPKRKNRWLELKNDETMHTNKKLAKGMMNLRNQLSEVEKYLGWYNRLKNVNETEASTYWKRTNNNIKKIKERILNIARTLQELEN